MIGPGSVAKSAFRNVPGDLPYYVLGQFATGPGQDGTGTVYALGCSVSSNPGAVAKSPGSKPFYPHTRATLYALGLLPPTILSGDTVVADPAAGLDPSIVWGYETKFAWGRQGAMVRPPRSLVVNVLANQPTFQAAFFSQWDSVLRPLGVSVYFSVNGGYASNSFSQVGPNDGALSFLGDPLIAPVPITSGTLAPVTVVPGLNPDSPPAVAVGLPNFNTLDSGRYDGGDLFWVHYSGIIAATVGGDTSYTYGLVLQSLGGGEGPPLGIPGYNMVASDGGDGLYVANDLTRYAGMLNAFATRLRRFGWLYMLDNVTAGSMPVGQPSDVLDPIVQALPPIAAAYDNAATVADAVNKIVSAAAEFFR